VTRTTCRWAVLALLLAGAAGARAETTEGLRLAPTLGWKRGDHRVDLGFSLRTRPEYWSAFVEHDDIFAGIKSKARLQYAWREQWIATAELQGVQLLDMDSTASGVEAVYRGANDMRTQAAQFQLRQAHLEWKPIPELFIRFGRQDVKLGAEVGYSEPDWKYLKSARLAERLVGTVGWSHVERAADALTAGYDFGSQRVDFFAGRPTTGVTAVDEGMRALHDVFYAGGAWTVKRDAWVKSSELSLFGVAYDDDRPVENGGLLEGVTVYTGGASWLGVYDLGPGKLDALLWGAGQIGDFDAVDHRAGAGAVEVGYQLPKLFAKPWLRVGVNAASGDGDPTDGRHATFFNLLPTNHLYSGFIDLVEFQNLVDPFVQLRLVPHARVALNLFVHWLKLASRDDARYGGTGAFDRKAFGYPATPSGGQRDVGVEYDAVATVTLHRAATLELGVSYLDGGDVLRALPERDAVFGYVSFELKY
jgi:hypothetical protein